MAFRKDQKRNRLSFCAVYIVKQGYNDLFKTDPEIAEEWDQTGNNNLKPEDFYRTSLRFVRWRCRFGHSYGMKIRDRTINGKGCKICEKTFQAAFMQMLIMRYAKRNGIAYEIGKDGFELYLPEQRMAFVAQKVSAPEEKIQTSYNDRWHGDYDETTGQAMQYRKVSSA